MEQQIEVHNQLINSKLDDMSLATRPLVALNVRYMAAGPQFESCIRTRIASPAVTLFQFKFRCGRSRKDGKWLSNRVSLFNADCKTKYVIGSYQLGGVSIIVA
ncbi:MAG: hypothetical protein KF862_23845 [Chitinophagaceae bacterium]|nr:hypothetical protein [Chitinophagaceae bacterium]